jgi:ATP-binding cassette, subfamily C, bacterial CydD
MFDRHLFRQALPAQAMLVTTVVLGAVAGGLAIAQAWLVSSIISRVFLEGVQLAQTVPLLAVLLGVIGLRSAVAWGGDVAAGAVAGRVKKDLREAVFAHLLALGPAYIQGERTGELTATVVDGVEALDPYFSQYLPQLATAALVPLTIFLVVLPLDWVSGVVLLLTAPLIPAFMILIGKASEAVTRKQFDLLGRLSAHFLDTLQGLTTLKTLGQSQAQAQVIGRVSDQYRQATLNVLRVAFLSALVLELVASISTALVAVEVGLRLLYGKMAFQPALMLLILAPEFYLPLRQLGLRFHAAAAGVSAAKRLFGILAIQPTVGQRRPEAVPLNSAQASSSGWETITLDDVHFSYAEGRAALRGVSCEIPAQQKTALVGPSGAGKSTIAQMLLRFVEPETGQIRSGQRPLSEIDMAIWRSQIAWVPQAPHLFHDTIAANLRLANPKATDEALVRAAQQAHLHDFVAALPQGYETQVGEGGARLSGGQAQRLALARAFLKDTPFIILDEPTSNVDPELEALLQDATDRLMRGRTVLVIAHRLNTIYQAEQILVLSAGRVAEAGQHAALLRQHGLYYRLVSASME